MGVSFNMRADMRRTPLVPRNAEHTRAAVRAAEVPANYVPFKDRMKDGITPRPFFPRGKKSKVVISLAKRA